jgi:PAS domain-containing protein
MPDHTASAEKSSGFTAEQMKYLIQNFRDGVLVENAARRVELVNSEFCTLFGIDCALALDNSKHMFQEPDQFAARIIEVLAERKLVKGDVLALRDGRIFERDYVPIFDNEVYSGHLWQYRNITQAVHTRRRQARLLDMEKHHCHIMNLFLQSNLQTRDVDTALNKVPARLLRCPPKWFPDPAILGHGQQRGV